MKNLLAATELLEQIAADRRLLEALPAGEQRRFHDAIARIHKPRPGAAPKANES